MNEIMQSGTFYTGSEFDLINHARELLKLNKCDDDFFIDLLNCITNNFKTGGRIRSVDKLSKKEKIRYETNSCYFSHSRVSFDSEDWPCYFIFDTFKNNQMVTITVNLNSRKAKYRFSYSAKLKAYEILIYMANCLIRDVELHLNTLCYGLKEHGLNEVKLLIEREMISSPKLVDETILSIMQTWFNDQTPKASKDRPEQSNLPNSDTEKGIGKNSDANYGLMAHYLNLLLMNLGVGAIEDRQKIISMMSADKKSAKGSTNLYKVITGQRAPVNSFKVSDQIKREYGSQYSELLKALGNTKTERNK